MSSRNKYLRDDRVEEGVGVLGLDLPLDPPVRGNVRDIGPVGGACAAGEDSEDATIPGEDDRARVPSIRKSVACPVGLVVGQNSDLDRGLPGDAVLLIGPREGFETIDATDGGPRLRPILYNEHALLTVDVEVLGVADLGVRDDAGGLEETIFGVLVVGLVGGPREQ